MNIIIANSVIFEHDAIGNDVLQQFQVLKGHGFSVFLYAEKVVADFAPYLLNRKAVEAMLQDKHNILIYHHGTLWEQGERLLNSAACIVLFKYHNITPPKYFEGYSEEYVVATTKGREQTERFAKNKHISHFLADSNFNRDELISYGASRDIVTILPPFLKIVDNNREKVNSTLLQKLSDGKLNVLFVGRLAPNKGHAHLIETIHAYTCFYDRNIRLNIVGGIDPRLEGYYSDLIARISYYRLHDIISFRERVDFIDLTTYYKASDIFLLMSEHEGFCVPILEAQYHRLPVIALNRGAVKYTIGDNRLVFDGPDYEMFACALRLVGMNTAIKQYLVEQGLKNYKNYDNTSTSRKLIEIISQVELGRTRRP